MENLSSLSEIFPGSQALAGGKSRPDELGQEDFMTLMVAQLKNQDPTKPVDNFQFLSQIAQFGTVNGIQDLNSEFGNLSTALLSSQSLQAANLVGREVVTGTNLGVLPAEGNLNASVKLPDTASGGSFYIQDSSGRVVQSFALPEGAAGDFSVQWDGSGPDGERLPVGAYRLSAEANVGGQTLAVSVFAHRRVESVTVDATGTGVQLNLIGGAQVGLAEVDSIF